MSVHIKAQSSRNNCSVVEVELLTRTRSAAYAEYRFLRSGSMCSLSYLHLQVS